MRSSRAPRKYELGGRSVALVRLPDVCLLERFSGPIEKLFAALFEEASAAQELIVNEDSLRIGFSELDTLGTGVIDTSVLLSALDKNGLQASLAEQAAVLRRFDPTGTGVVGMANFVDHFR
ncbi:hypothetical protein FOZ62_009316 [Perkinsus olseni]|uniref:EF-hand domain-containing protein n=2 Tax=Perkinsus olseni TaxID=32597 RepID=A0A7J6SY16_PEROL|nr:hypothetical protein FOZ62_009316 [Perkinsus olseni]